MTEVPDGRAAGYKAEFREEWQLAVTVSVIVPVYNMASGDKLKWCLDSLVHQTMRDDSIEIIAVDDCSTDRSWELMKEYERNWPARFLAVHSAHNRHQGGAKNIGLALARGTWISFIDADDWVVPDYYERMLRKAAETGADMVGCDYSLTGEHSWIVGKIVHNNSPEQTGVMDTERYRRLLLDSGSLAVKIYRRRIIYGSRRAADPDSAPDRKEVLGPDGTFTGQPENIFPEDIFYEDNAVSNTWMLRAKHFEYLPEPLYYYYQHVESTVHTVSRKNLEDRCTAGRQILSEAAEYGYLDTYRMEIEYQFTVLFYINTLFSAMPREQHLRGCYSFTRDLAAEMKRTFPDFQSNPYYRQRTDPEEQRLAAMQMKSHIRFYLYYRVLWAYRNLRKKFSR